MLWDLPCLTQISPTCVIFFLWFEILHKTSCRKGFCCLNKNDSHFKQSKVQILPQAFMIQTKSMSPGSAQPFPTPCLSLPGTHSLRLCLYRNLLLLCDAIPLLNLTFSQG